MIEPWIIIIWAVFLLAAEQGEPGTILTAVIGAYVFWVFLGGIWVVVTGNLLMKVVWLISIIPFFMSGLEPAQGWEKWYKRFRGSETSTREKEC